MPHSGIVVSLIGYVIPYDGDIAIDVARLRQALISAPSLAFATLKNVDCGRTYQGSFLMRGLVDVRTEFLTALAHNLRRALNILGVEAVTAAAVA